MENHIIQPYAEIVFPVPVEHAFTYKIPERFNEDAVPGVRVLASFGRRKTTGFIVSRKNETDLTELKEIEDVLDPIPLFTPEVLELAKWIAEYYICGWGEVLKAALPSGIHLDSEKIIRLVDGHPHDLISSLENRAPRQAEIIRRLLAENPIRQSKLLKTMSSGNIYASLKKLKSAGHIRMELELPKPKVSIKHEIFVSVHNNHTSDSLYAEADSIRKRAPKQANCLEVLASSPNQEFSRPELCRLAEINTVVLNTLEQKGFIKFTTKEVVRDYYKETAIEQGIRFDLNKDQASVLSAIIQKIDSNDFSPMLLHGVTGSGKTQVYIETIYHCMAKNKNAIVLVPEIALTPQMVHRFRSHFGDKVAVFHSRMSPGERYDSWRQTWEGKHHIVIGPRSAIFSPLKNIGLVIIDEEHEPSYKQTDMTPKYNARDVSIIRAYLNKAVVVLGSATPSIETFFNASINKYSHLSMPNRIDNIPMPAIEIVNMKREPKIIGRKEPVIFSKRLREKIDEKLAHGEQIILFQNRRGFATLIKCKDCNYLAKCQNCDISLTFHIHGSRLKCHYCGFSTRAPERCPECGGVDIFMKGVGTQRIEEEINTLFPGVKVLRMDLDTTKGRMAHDRILSKFGSGEYPILLGTQMVAKGLDFPNVTLVGVISADTELLFPDFRAGERTFQLLTQVAGRAGRKNKQGDVIIQTYTPEHPSLQFAKYHDYHSFFKMETSDRRGLGYPPFSRIVNILFRGEDEAAVKKTAEQFAQEIPVKRQFRMLGPAPAALAKIQGNYRWQILFMSLKQNDTGGTSMKNAIKRALNNLKKKHRIHRVTISMDVDPISIL